MSRRISLTLLGELHDELVRTAELEGRSLEHVLTAAAEAYLRETRDLRRRLAAARRTADTARAEGLVLPRPFLSAR